MAPGSAGLTGVYAQAGRGTLAPASRAAKAQLIWYASPNYSFKGNRNRTDYGPLNSGVRPKVEEDLLPPSSIPDLSKLRGQAEWFALNRGIRGGGSGDHTAYVLQANAIRLADAAIRDYLLGGHSIAQHHDREKNQFGLTPLLLATTHFESCIWHLERFIKHVKALRSCATAELELKELIPRTSIFLQPTVESRLTQLRHTLSHLEKDALSGKIPPGASLALLPLKGGLSISGHDLTWDELSTWLIQAHECSGRLAQFKPAVVNQSGDQP